MFNCFVSRILTPLAAIAAIVGGPRQARAQSGATPPASASAVTNPFAAPTSVKRVSISKAVFGDAGMVVNARDDGYIELAAAGPNKTIYLKLRILAARAWLDSSLRMMKARVKKADAPRTYRSDVQEFGSTTTMALTRSVTAGESQYGLTFSENSQSSFSTPIEAEEADVFVAIVRKAVAASAKMLEKTDTTAARADSIAKADSVARADSIAKARKRRAAAKRAASPPPADSTAKAPAVKPPAAKPAVKDSTKKPSSP